MPEKLIRCFIAIKMPDTLLTDIGQYIQQIKKLAPDVRWVKARSIHITLKFLGEIEENLLQQVVNELHPLKNLVEPFDLVVSGFGSFPSEKNPRVFWIGLEADVKNSLFTLHKWIDTKLESLGFTKEKRRFSPHLTVGRVKRPQNYNKLYHFIERNPFPKRIFKVEKVILMRSELNVAGAIYTPIEEYFFKS
jgi:2'-5' RNA ligase